MKLYDFPMAPNPRRVRIFLAEKGVDVTRVPVDLRAQEQLGASFLAINPFATVPVLELDDGRRIAESVAICRYIEEIHPAPPLFGSDPYDKAVIEQWQRHGEFEGFLAVAEAFRNGTAGFKGRALTGPYGYDQIPELAARGRQRTQRFFALVDQRLGASEFIAGPRFSIADITLLVTFDFAVGTKQFAPESVANLVRWHDVVAARPSARA
jgi:glutathione S-transferase